MKNKMLIPGVALWHGGERTAAAGGWVLIVVCVLAVVVQLVTPGAFAALTQAPMAQAYLGVGAPSVILYTSELFLAAAVANSMLYRSRNHLVIPAAGWARVFLVFLCPRLAFANSNPGPSRDDSSTGNDQSKLAASGEVSTTADDGEAPGKMTPQIVSVTPNSRSGNIDTGDDQLVPLAGSPFVRKAAAVHMQLLYFGALFVAAAKGIGFMSGRSWYVTPLPDDYGFLTVLVASLLLVATLLAVWLTITLETNNRSSQPQSGCNTPEEPRTPAEPGAQSQLAGTSSATTTTSPRTSWLSVLVPIFLVAALIRLSLVRIEVRSALWENHGGGEELLDVMIATIPALRGGSGEFLGLLMILPVFWLLYLCGLFAILPAAGVELLAVGLVVGQLRWARRNQTIPIPQGRLKRFGLASSCPGWFRWRTGDTNTAVSRNCWFFVFMGSYVVFIVTAYVDVWARHGFSTLVNAGAASTSLMWATAVVLPFLVVWLRWSLKDSAIK